MRKASGPEIFKITSPRTVKRAEAPASVFIAAGLGGLFDPRDELLGRALSKRA